MTRAEFLARRKKGLGGSDMAAVMGLDPYRTATDVYLEKTTEQPEKTGPHLDRGNAMEPIIRELYRKETGHNVFQVSTYEDDWAVGNVDGVIWAKGDSRKDGYGILEIKCPSLGSYQRIKMYGIPENYQIQMQHYLWLSECWWGEFAIFNADKWELTRVRVERDEEIIRHIREHGERFWNDCVLAGKPPEIKERDTPVLPPVGGQVVALEGEEARLVAACREMKALADEALALAAEAKKALMDKLAPGVYEAAGARVYISQQEGRKGLDKLALQAENPGLDLARYEKQGEPFTTLRIYDV